MAEKRKPDATMVLTGASGKKYRYEIYQAKQFLNRMGNTPFAHAENPDLMLQQVDVESGDFVRVRVNGVWMPQGRRAFYLASRVCNLIGRHLLTELKEPEQ